MLLNGATLYTKVNQVPLYFSTGGKEREIGSLDAAGLCVLVCFIQVHAEI